MTAQRMVSALPMSDVSVRVSDDIFRALEVDIILGRLAPGQKLGEEVVSDRFSASRHQVRAALMGLETRGLVKKTRNRGFSMRSFTPREVEELYDTREILQRQAALRIPLPIASEPAATLRHIEDEYERAVEIGDFQLIHTTNDRFHIEMFRLSSNRQLADLVQHYMDLSYVIRGNAFSADHCATASKEHRLMLSLLDSRDSWSLAQICVDHIQYSKDRYLTFLDQQPCRVPPNDE